MGLLDFLSGGIIKSVGKVADALITSDEEKLEKENEKLKTKLNYKLEEEKVITNLKLNQMEINKLEAQHETA